MKPTMSFDYEIDEAEDRRYEKIQEAKQSLLHFFTEHREDVFYERQLQVIFEGSFFHWVTVDALHELLEDKKLQSELVPLSEKVNIRFYWTPSNRYWRRKSKITSNLVLEYSDHNFLTALGIHGESMFDVALPRAGFMPVASNANKFKGNEWTESSHNLDRIFIRDNIPYGTEIKNTLDYIPQEEMKIKLKICAKLGLKPLFIMRMAPKDYIWKIRQAGGFSLIIKYQLYPHGYRDLAKRVREQLKLPVDCPRAIEEGTIKRFLDWHIKNCQPAAKTHR